MPHTVMRTLDAWKILPHSLVGGLLQARDCIAASKKRMYAVSSNMFKPSAERQIPYLHVKCGYYYCT